MQFSLLFVDIPAALCAIVVLVTGFKAPKMIRRMKEVRDIRHFYTSLIITLLLLGLEQVELLSADALC